MLLVPPSPVATLSPHAIFSAPQIALQLFREYSPCKQHWQTSSFSPLHSSLKITTRGRSFRLLKSVPRVAQFYCFFFSSFFFFFVVSLSRKLDSFGNNITWRTKDSREGIVNEILFRVRFSYAADRRDPSSTESRMKSDHRLIKRFQRFSLVSRHELGLVVPETNACLTISVLQRNRLTLLSSKRNDVSAISRNKMDQRNFRKLEK